MLEMSIWIRMVSIILGILILLVLWNQLYIHTNEYRLRCGELITKFKKLPDYGLDGIVIGSSQTYYGFDFETFGYSIINLAGNPQSLQMCCCIVKENISRVKKGGVLLICLPFCAGIFCGFSDRFHNEIYYSILHDCRVIDGYSKGKQFIYRYFPVLGDWKNVLRVFHDYPTASGERLAALSDTDAQKLVKDRIREWKRLTGIDIRDTMFTEVSLQQLEENMKLLKDAILLCKKKGIYPVIITPPIMDIFFHSVSDDFWRRGYTGPLRQLVDAEGIGYIDFCGERLYSDDNTLFQGIDFLNSEGRKKLTEETLSRLKGMGLL